jgi:zinc protease
VPRLTSERVVIDGVPAYVANSTGPVVAGLTFRVGIADESALDRGLTALLAELAAIDVDDVEFDVGSTLTTFVAKGHARVVADALAAICRALPAFDDDDLTQLADTILDEPQQPPTLQETLLGLRFGAQNYGVRAIPPLGLLRISADHARAWADRVFTRDNAALWSSAPLAPDISLSLPAGSRVAPPGRGEPECELPAWCPNAWVGSLFRDVVDCSIVAPGSDVTTIALRALDAELFERLEETGLRGSQPEFEVEAWAEDITHVALSLPTAAHGNDGIECILGSIDDFADLGPDPDELADAISEVRTWATDAANAAAVAEMLAGDELRLGRPRSLDGFLAGVHEVTAEQVAAGFDDMRNEIIVAVPSDAEIVDPRFSLLERARGFALDGTKYRRSKVTGAPDDDARLIVGDDGVTYANLDELLTVCFEDCVAAVQYPDDSIALFDIDGTTIELSQADWRDGERAFAAIEAAIPDDVLLEARRTLGTAPVSPDDDADFDDVELEEEEPVDDEPIDDG